MMRDFGVPLLFLAAISLLSTIALRRTIRAEFGSADDDGALSALFVAFAVIAVAVFVGVARAANELARPMTELAEAADRVARGELGRPVPPLAGPAELRAVGESVERMREALARTIAELERERALLERRVEERTSELSGALEALKRAQAALIQHERMASVGELVAGVAHEIYNPLSAIAGASAPLEELSSDLGELFEAYREAEARLPREDREALERRRAEADLDGSLDDLGGIASLVRRAVDRSVRIVQNLKNFSRAPGEATPADLHAGIDETLLLLGPRLRQAGARVERRFGELPEITCRGGEINQVFMNLFTNAIQALEASRRARPDGAEAWIRIETRLEGEEAVVAVSDSGPGVPADIRARIFDPFFTTKARGEGTGLGLSISAEIARRHGGSLSLEKDRSGGATFVLRLPRAPASAKRTDLGRREEREEEGGRRDVPGDERDRGEGRR